jgi:AbrB family looped-hinge helix DNA binding protein
MILISDILNPENGGVYGGKTCITEIRHRGQITIPKAIRQASSMEEGQQFSIILLGDSILITPKRLDLDEARGRSAGLSGRPTFPPKRCWRV